jgi:hypothetical protein
MAPFDRSDSAKPRRELLRDLLGRNTKPLRSGFFSNIQVKGKVSGADYDLPRHVIRFVIDTFWTGHGFTGAEKLLSGGFILSAAGTPAMTDFSVAGVEKRRTCWRVMKIKQVFRSRKTGASLG